jgi:hypothetical protein
MSPLDTIRRYLELHSEAQNLLAEAETVAKEIGRKLLKVGLPGTFNGYVEMDLNTDVESIYENNDHVLFTGSVYSFGCTDRGSFQIPKELLRCHPSEVDAKIAAMVEQRKLDEAERRLKNRQDRERRKAARAERIEAAERAKLAELKAKYDD